jgi:hypothetical protein
LAEQDNSQGCSPEALAFGRIFAGAATTVKRAVHFDELPPFKET